MFGNKHRYNITINQIHAYLKGNITPMMCFMTVIFIYDYLYDADDDGDSDGGVA